MKTLQESRTFEGVAKTGKPKFWKLRLVQDGPRYGIQKVWWQEGSVIQESTPRWVDRPKSQDTIRGQAQAEFDALIAKKTDRMDTTFVAPMLAHSFQGKDVAFPVFIQPKFDGHRMLTDGERAWTRGLKEHKATVNHLIFDTMGHVVDGEVMLPKERLLQRSAAAIKGKVGAESKRLHYYVYDVVMDAPYADRLAVLHALEPTFPAGVELAPTFVANSAEEVWQYHAAFVAAGYEGAIVRIDGHGYEVGTRSGRLLKVKQFQDEECQVTSVNEGEGSNEGLAILVLETKAGVEFRAVPEGGHDLRADLWKRRHDVVGQWWTVRYFYKSAAGKPIFPVAVAHREEGE